jgi:hypothetical protein
LKLPLCKKIAQHSFTLNLSRHFNGFPQKPSAYRPKHDILDFCFLQANFMVLFEFNKKIQFGYERNVFANFFVSFFVG